MTETNLLRAMSQLILAYSLIILSQRQRERPPGILRTLQVGIKRA
ncbi:hypothetical protein [Sphingomonas sp. GB1N7]